MIPFATRKKLHKIHTIPDGIRDVKDGCWAGTTPPTLANRVEQWFWNAVGIFAVVLVLSVLAAAIGVTVLDMATGNTGLVACK